MDNQKESLRKKLDRFVREDFCGFLHDFAPIAIVAIVLFFLLFRIVFVYGPSMNDTLIHDDFLLLQNSLFYRNPKAGDIVVVSKESFDNGKPIIKRVIAVEGQTVDIDFDKGIVYVDGAALDEPYTLTPTINYQGIDFPLTVSEGCLFVLGDNRAQSKDSRNPEIGLIDERQVVGKAIFLLFPGKDPLTDQRDFSRIGVVS